ncbi:Hypothetical predicted protein [Xyrichtys novacula]|uniref:Uncharacterized protein n=1 Tax=Xyrichtys novacula TaxID=13765 RepID=A0AAV1EZV6_XYRNO|nr:Hypothetical predicted protein [Xyrichtys novacula]
MSGYEHGWTEVRHGTKGQRLRQPFRDWGGVPLRKKDRAFLAPCGRQGAIPSPKPKPIWYLHGVTGH